MTTEHSYLDYAFALESALREDGFAEQAHLLRSAIDRSSTGTELCMALRFIVQNALADSNDTLTRRCKRQSRGLLGRLDQVLNERR